MDNENDYISEEEFNIEDITIIRLYSKGTHIAHKFNINEINTVNIYSIIRI